MITILSPSFGTLHTLYGLRTKTKKEMRALKVLPIKVYCPEELIGLDILVLVGSEFHHFSDVMIR